MKRVLGVLCVVLCAALCVGCAVWNELLPASVQEAAPAAPADPLTGGELLWPDQRPMAAVISNAAGAARQWGIADASVVLEALTEGRSTTLCLVYPSVQAMPQVGPAAQGKDVYWQLLAGQNVIPVQKGASVYARNLLQYTGVQPVDALTVGTNAFRADEEQAYADEFAWYTDGGAVAGVLPALGIDTQGETAALTAFGAPPGGTDGAASARVAFSASSATGFAYDAGQGVYRMSRADGTPQADAATGVQAAFENVVVLYSASSLKDDGYTREYELSGGMGVYLNGGSWQRVTWNRGASGAAFLLYGEDGKPLPLQAGRSYVALLGGFGGQALTVWDAAGVQQELAAAEG